MGRHNLSSPTELYVKYTTVDLGYRDNAFDKYKLTLSLAINTHYQSTTSNEWYFLPHPLIIKHRMVKSALKDDIKTSRRSFARNFTWRCVIPIMMRYKVTLTHHIFHSKHYVQRNTTHDSGWHVTRPKSLLLIHNGETRQLSQLRRLIGLANRAVDAFLTIKRYIHGIDKF